MLNMTGSFLGGVLVNGYDPRPATKVGRLDDDRDQGPHPHPDERADHGASAHIEQVVALRSRPTQADHEADCSTDEDGEEEHGRTLQLRWAGVDSNHRA